MIARTLSDDPHDPVIGSKADRSLLDGLNSDRRHFFATNLLNESLYVSSAVSTMTGWTVALGMPGALVELPARRTLAAVTGGGTLAVGIALGIGWLLARTLMKRQVAERRLLQLEFSRRRANGPPPSWRAPPTASSRLTRTGGSPSSTSAPAH